MQFFEATRVGAGVAVELEAGEAELLPVPGGVAVGGVPGCASLAFRFGTAGAAGAACRSAAGQARAKRHSSTGSKLPGLVKTAS